MKTIRLVAAAMLFAALSVVSISAQTAPAAGASAAQGGFRVAVINTLAFDDDKTGITRYVSAMKQLETEFKPRQDKLTTMNTRLQGLAKEIETLGKSATGPNSVVSQEAIEKKRQEGEKLQREMKFEQDDANAAFQTRQATLVGPIFSDISKAIEDYRKQKGYAIILDVAKLAQDGSVLAMAPDADVTADFIKFYNARPAGTATTSAPK